MADNLVQKSLNISNQGRPKGFPRATASTLDNKRRPVIQNAPTNNVASRTLKRQIKEIKGIRSSGPSDTRADDRLPSNKPSFPDQLGHSLDISNPISTSIMGSNWNSVPKQTVTENRTEIGQFNNIYSLLPERKIIN